MAYALVYTTVSGDVQPQVAGRTISASTSPSTSEVEQWLAEAELALVGALGGAGVSVPEASDDGANLIRAWASEYPLGKVKIAWLDQLDEGRELVSRFWERLSDIRANPSFYDAMLSGGSAGDSSRQCRGYVLDNKDGKSIGNGDFDPIFDEDFEA